MAKLWNIPTGTRYRILVERSTVNILLPLSSVANIELEIISGSVPNGTRLEGNYITGTVFEVAYDTTFTVVFRASTDYEWQDCTIEFVVTGPDDPLWATAEGLLNVGSNNALFILDSEQIDFQLSATDTDLSAGDELTYFIADGDGVLPPGITMSDSGRITGTTEPLLSLDKRYVGGGYDTSPFAGLPMDYAALSSNGYASFYYDTVDYGYNEPTSNPRKLNRYYPFAVTVTDGDSFVRREFKIYLVGDDYLKADNTLMQSSTGVFTADVTNVRTPTWITPRDLGYKRASNYTTLYLDIIDNWTLEGVVVYTLEDVNDDGSASELPPGMSLDSQNGEVTGRIPYQPAITQNYKFTVRATRLTTDLETVSIVGNFYEDVLLGKNSVKIYKIDLTGDLDGVNDLFELVNRNVLLGNRQYRVTNVDDRNPDYDILYLADTLAPSISLILSRTATVSTDYMFVSRLKESEKEKYAGRTLKFSGNEQYKINTITPYIEWEISQANPSNDPILPANAPRLIELSENYYVGDYVINGTATGGDGKIYKCTTAHNTVSQTDIDGISIEVNGIIQIDFESGNWLEVAESISGLSLADRLTATSQALKAEYGDDAHITVVNDTTWKLLIPSTATSRIKSNIQNFFIGPDSTEITAKLLRDNEDKIKFDVNLSSQIEQGRNIGIALFRNDAFFKNIIVASNDIQDIPSTAKTFEVNVIGEIDSEIKWLTPANLGTINANFTSTLKIEAQTTVPDTKMIYSLKSGKLPFGLVLNYDGEIIGSARQFGTVDKPGLTIFENKTITWDGANPGITTFDRDYKFTVQARDRFNYTAIEQEFTLTVEDFNNTRYTDVYMRPMLPPVQRKYFQEFISNPDIFTPSKIYRPGDPTFGLQSKLDMLIFAGVEAKDLEYFTAAAAKNHKRKTYILGEIKSAVAKNTALGDTVYEVVYIDVIDPANAPDRKVTAASFNAKNSKKLTIDQMQYSILDDVTRTGAGYTELPVYTRTLVKFVFSETDEITVETRGTGDQDVNVDDADFEVTVRDSGDIEVVLQKGDSEPFRFRPDTNTIKTDNTAINVSQSTDSIKYISSVDHMRLNIKQIGDEERNYLPLWMRTAQDGFQELDFITAIPIAYCKAGQSADIINNINNSGFDPKIITYDIDRYIIKSSENNTDESYILFANYQFNV